MIFKASPQVSEFSLHATSMSTRTLPAAVWPRKFARHITVKGHIGQGRRELQQIGGFCKPVTSRGVAVMQVPCSARSPNHCMNPPDFAPGTPPVRTNPYDLPTRSLLGRRAIRVIDRHHRLGMLLHRQLEP